MKQDISLKEGVAIFFKGMFMGGCDLIPGISGGTIAFITGIYPRMINSIRHFSFHFLKVFVCALLRRDRDSYQEFKVSLAKLDLLFLTILIAGIFTSIFLGARVIRFLLDEYFSFTIAFFIGLIIASAKLVYAHIEQHSWINTFLMLGGAGLGISLAFFIPRTIHEPSYLYVFFSGFLSINAMFLPGISGAFILFILGIYDFILEIIHSPGKFISYLLVFQTGVVFGAFTISRIIHFLFIKDKSKTLSILLGLVVGALIIPVKRIATAGDYTLANWLLLILSFCLLGILLVLFIDGIQKKKSQDSVNDYS